MEKQPFCNNSLCEFNKKKVAINEYRIFIEKDGKQREIDRHMYQNRTGDKFELCSICHAAVSMLSV